MWVVTPELIGIVTVGVALVGLNLALWRDGKSDIAAVRSELTAVRESLVALRERVSRIEGVIEGVLAADRRGAEPPPA